MNDRVWMTEKEILALSKYAALVSKPILEIGTFMGGATEILARANPSVAVWSIDVYGVPEVHKLTPNKIYGDHLISLDNAFLIVGLAEKIAKFWDTKLGMLIIDGEHENNAPLRDLNDWIHNLSNNGYLVFHDSIVGQEYISLYDSRKINGFIDVAKAVDSAVQRGYKIIETVDTMTILQKRRIL